ncbi:MAG: DUF1592 domain-containing protein [Myxococcales bacterium]|nr:DUF1592 domain-containing protein [Myxococcales bacterium]
MFCSMQHQGSRFRLPLWAAALAAGVAVGPLGPAGAQASPLRPYENDTKRLVSTYCGKCHGEGDKIKGGLDLSRFGTTADVLADAQVWKDVRDALETHDMPPDDAPAPSPAERAALVAWIEEALKAMAEGGASPGKPLLRRLTALEYNNAVRDLMGLTHDVFPVPNRLRYKRDYFDTKSQKIADRLLLVTFDNSKHFLLPGASLPPERRAKHGFSRQGEALSFSPLLLEKFIALAHDIAHSDRLLGAGGPALQALFAAPAKPHARKELRRRLLPLIERAFRGQASPAEHAAYLGAGDKALRQGLSFEQSLRTALEAVLSSPRFLLVSEDRGDKEGVRALSGPELATRLALFLWSSLPDDTLLAEARAGRLATDEGLDAQVTRMLRDPRAIALSDSFGVEWMQLDKLASAHPDELLFPSYYYGIGNTRSLGEQMGVEATLLFDSVLLENRPLATFVDAPDLFVDRQLTKHYGYFRKFRTHFRAARRHFTPEIDKRQGDELREIWLRLPAPDRRRGGLLTSGAVLTLTSMPKRTSPVYRGLYVLEAIFNRPPPAPEIAVPPLDAAKKEGQVLSVRQQLELHRADPACASCHDRIDPLGFVLANFDGVGSYVTQEAGVPVDASGKLLDGRSFQGPEDFKQLLTRDMAPFARGFIEHLLSFATCRPLTATDDLVVRQIAERTAGNGYRFHDLLREVVKSAPFRFTSTLGPSSTSRVAHR